MKSCVDELFMRNYFYIEALFDKAIEERKHLFVALGRMFLLSDERLIEIYRLIENPQVKSIVSQNDCKQYRRIKEYEVYHSCSQPCESANPEIDDIIRIKSETILDITKQYNNNQSEVSSRIAKYNNLQLGINNGLVDALRTSGILRCEGIFFEKDTVLGLHDLKKAADWNDPIALLALLHYCENDREYNLSRLKMCLSSSPFAEIIPLTEGFYGIDGKQTVTEVKLLDSLFKGAVLQRHTYNSTYARILYSNVLGIKGKESVLWDQDATRRAQVGSLPLKFERTNSAKFLPISSKRIPFVRKSEIEIINKSMSNINLCNCSSYRPLCLVCDSKYVLNTYCKAIATGFKDCCVQKFNVADLKEYDLNPTTNNVFLRDIDEDKPNCFMFCFNGEISDNCVNSVCEFVRCDMRAKLSINALNVSLNLSAILPICFSDRHNVKVLEKYCNVIYLENVSANELPNAIKDILYDRKTTFAVEDIDVGSDIVDSIKLHDIDDIERAINNLILRQSVHSNPVNITRDELEKELNIKTQEKPHIGFGG